MERQATEEDTSGRSLRRTMLGVGAATVIVGLIVLLGIGLANRSPVTGLSGFTRVGKPAPQIEFPVIGRSGNFDLASHAGTPVVVNFWASWCPPCRVEAPLLEAVSRQYTGEVQFVGVDIQDAEQDGIAYLDEYGITYPNGLDVDGKITVDYGVIGIPVTFFVGKTGIVERRYVGAVDEDAMVRWLDELVAGVPASEGTEATNLKDFFHLN